MMTYKYWVQPKEASNSHLGWGACHVHSKNSRTSLLKCEELTYLTFLKFMELCVTNLFMNLFHQDKV